MIETVAEGLVLAEKSELGKENLHKFIEAIFPGPHALYSRRMISGDYYDRNEVCTHEIHYFNMKLTNLAGCCHRHGQTSRR